MNLAAARNIVLAIGLALALAACGQQKGSERPPEPGDTAVARVDGKVVWASDVKREAVAQGLIGEGEPLDMSSNMFRQLLDEVVDRRLLAAEALRQKLDKSTVAQRRLEAARERILADMVVEGAVEKKVTEPAIRGLYQEQQRLSRLSVELKARQIVLATQPQAEEVKRLLAQGASFEALAMERSTDAATRFSGGDFGGFFTLDVMPDPYVNALKGAKAGDLIGPFAVEGGWAMVRVDEMRQETPLTLEAVRPQIVRLLTYDEVRDLLETLRGKAKIEPLLGPTQDVPGAPREPASAPPPKPATPAPAAPAQTAPGQTPPAQTTPAQPAKK